MAVLGAQLVFTMVTASFLNKLSPYFSFGRWILCNKLVRYLYPSDEDLKCAAGIPANNKKGRKHKPANSGHAPVTIPKNTDIQLELTPVTVGDCGLLPFYHEYQWLLDFAVCGIFVYTLTEVYYAGFASKDDFNLSMVWNALVIGFSVKMLLSVTKNYFKTDGGAEKIICVVMGFFFLICSLGILIIREDILEFGLDAGYANFSQAAHEYLEKQNLVSTGPVTLVTFKVFLAFVSALLGAFLTFPGLRLAKMHLAALRYARENAPLRLLLYLNVSLPALVLLAWIRPLTQQLRQTRGLRLDEDTLHTCRIYLLLAVCLFRLALVRTHLQAYLNLAQERMTSLKREAGRISAQDVQRRVVQVFYYLCVVALQYVAPLVLLACCTLALKTLGAGTWLHVFGVRTPEWRARAPGASRPLLPEEVEAAVSQVSAALHGLRQVFAPVFFRGLFSYLCWWINTAWFATTMFGLAYYNYFDH